jgi:Rad3-related DNA helicase
MAKIFSSEKLSLNGDNIRIQSVNAGEFEITDSESSVLISRNSIETAHSSLNAQDVAEAASRSQKDSDLDTNVSSLNAADVAEAATRSEKDSDLDTNVSSLNAQDVAEAATRSEKDSDLDTNVSSLNAQDVAEAATRSEKDSDLDTDVSSLMAEINDTNTNIDSNDVVALSEALDSGIDSKTISFGRTFASAPTVSATMFNDQGDPIIGAMISEISTTQCTVVFSDDLPSADYELKILASI